MSYAKTKEISGYLLLNELQTLINKYTEKDLQLREREAKLLEKELVLERLFKKIKPVETNQRCMTSVPRNRSQLSGYERFGKFNEFRKAIKPHIVMRNFTGIGIQQVESHLFQITKEKGGADYAMILLDLISEDLPSILKKKNLSYSRSISFLLESYTGIPPKNQF